MQDPLSFPPWRPLSLAPPRWQGLALLLAVGCVGSGAGVPDPGGGGGKAPGSWAEIQTLVLVPLCAEPCHHGAAAPKGLSLEPQVAWKQLVNVPASERPSMLRVQPGQPDESYLVAKIVPFDARRVGSRMPRLGPPFLSQPQIAAVKAWIAAGAKTDWRADAPDAAVLQTPVADAGSTGSAP